MVRFKTILKAKQDVLMGKTSKAKGVERKRQTVAANAIVAANEAIQVTLQTALMPDTLKRMKAVR